MRDAIFSTCCNCDNKRRFDSKSYCCCWTTKKSARALARNTRIDHPTPHLVHHQRRSFTAAIIPITILGRIQETEDEGCRLQQYRIVNNYSKAITIMTTMVLVSKTCDCQKRLLQIKQMIRIQMHIYLSCGQLILVPRLHLLMIQYYFLTLKYTNGF